MCHHSHTASRSLHSTASSNDILIPVSRLHGQQDRQLVWQLMWVQPKSSAGPSARFCQFYREMMRLGQHRYIKPSCTALYHAILAISLQPSLAPELKRKSKLTGLDHPSCNI
eukprot:1136567-Pelagomonas_calceolata.AAC.1